MKVTKAEARLEVLRGAGIDINKWLQKAGDNHRNEQLTPSTLGESAGVAFTQPIQCMTTEEQLMYSYYVRIKECNRLTMYSTLFPLLCI